MEEESKETMGPRTSASAATPHHHPSHHHHSSSSSPSIALQGPPASPRPGASSFAAFYLHHNQQSQQHHQHQKEQQQQHHHHPHHHHHHHQHQQHNMHPHHHDHLHQDHQHSHPSLPYPHGDAASAFPPTTTNPFTPHAPHQIVNAPTATRPNPGPAPTARPGIHHHHNLAIVANPTISDASTTTPPQPSGHPQMAGMAMDMSSPEPFKKKRGRPRKYSVDVNGSALALGPCLTAPSTAKKARHYGKKAQMNALGAAGQGFTPHIIAIAAGEDVSITVMSFLKQENWGMCILSASGAISNVTLCQPATSGGVITYEGRFDILSLSGSFLPSENGGSQSRAGGLTVSLAGADGRVIGGEVTGIFVAASPVKVVVGTFLPEIQKSRMQGGSAQSIQPAETATDCPLYVPMQQQSCMQGHNSGGIVDDSRQYHRPSDMMPSQSLDWGGNQLDTDS